MARLARSPVLDGVMAAHHQRHVADALIEPRMRRARAEPAFVDETSAGQHFSALAEPALRFLNKGFRLMNVAIRDSPFSAKRKAEQGGERRGQFERLLGRNVDEAVIGGGDHERFGSTKPRDQGSESGVELAELLERLG